jgi:hypothetical protein
MLLKAFFFLIKQAISIDKWRSQNVKSLFIKIMVSRTKLLVIMHVDKMVA